MSIEHPFSRRQFLTGAYGMGTVALATLLREEGLLANPALAGLTGHYDLKPKPAHGFGQAKAMISMFINQKFRRFNLADLPVAYVATVVYALLVMALVVVFFGKKRSAP